MLHFTGPVTINLNLSTTADLGPVLEALREVHTALGELRTMTESQFLALFARIDAATTAAAASATAIGNRITALTEAIAGMGLTAEQEAAIAAHLEGVATGTEALAASLSAMAVTPTEPTPVPVPAPLPEL